MQDVTRCNFYSLVCFHWEYLRNQKQHVRADTVLKSGCVQFLNLLTLTKMGSASDKKWFLLTHLLSLRIFEALKFENVSFQGK